MKNEIRKIAENPAQALTNPSGFAAGLGRLAVTLLMVICASSALWAQGLSPKPCPGQTGQFYICQGDIVVADATAGQPASSWAGSTGALFLIDPNTGVQTLISQGGLLQQTVGVVVADDGALVATDRITGVIRVDPRDGSQSYIYQANPMLNDFFGITKDGGGNFIVTDTGWDPTTPYPTSANKRNLNTQGRVLRIDKTTFAVTVLWQAAPLANPFGIALDPNDFSIIVSDMNAYNHQGAIFRIPSVGNPIVVWGPSGNGQQVTQTSSYNCPLGITVLATGDILATVFNYINLYGCAQPRPVSGNTGNIFRVDIAHGQQVPFVNIANFDWLMFPFGITQEASQNVLFVDEGNDGVYRLDLNGNIVPCLAPCASATWDSGLVLSGGFPPGTRPGVPNSLHMPVGISYAKAQPPAATGVPPTVSINGAPSSSPEGTAIVLTSSVTPASGTTYSWSVTKTRRGTTTANWATGTGSSLTFTPDDDGTYVVSHSVTVNGATGTAPGVTITVTNVSPSVMITGIPASSVTEGTAINLGSLVSTPAAADMAGGFSYAWSVATNGSSVASGANAALLFTPNHAGTYTVTLSATDKDGASGTATGTITATDVAPVITSVIGPTSAKIQGSAVSLTANFTDAGTGNTHSCQFTWGDTLTSAGTVTETNGSGSCTQTHTYASDGVYEVGVTVTDDGGLTASSVFQFVVIFDPTEGYVQGSGSFTNCATPCQSAAGPYVAYPSLTGTPHFGFYVKYAKGALLPSGTNSFKFAHAGINFKATAFEWLLISGANAQYKGSGTINGAGNYEFLITITDGQQTGGTGVDMYRIKLVDNSTGQVVYDNVTIPGSSPLTGYPDGMNTANPEPISTGRVVVFVNTAPAVSSLTLDQTTINEGGQATLTGAFTDPDAGQSHTATINWGDGTANTNISIAAGTFTLSATHTFKATTTAINVTVKDNFGATGTGSTAITVNNVAPIIGTVTKTPSGAVAVNTPVTIKVNFTDPGALDKHTCSAALGDGQTTAGTVTENNGNGNCTVAYTYTAVGSYTAVITVTDKDGSSTSTNVAIVVDTPPAISSPLSLTGPTITDGNQIHEGDQVTLSGSFTDPDTADTHTVTIKWGDGGITTINLAAGTLNFSATYTYVDNPAGIATGGTFTINVTVADSPGLKATGSASITVNNVAPSLPSSTTSITLPIWVTFSDPGRQDLSHTCTVSWGDGTPPTSFGAGEAFNGTGYCTTNHSYTSSGPHTITVTVTDKDGGSGTNTFSVAN
jgi:hypothetical protein